MWAPLYSPSVASAVPPLQQTAPPTALADAAWRKAEAPSLRLTQQRHGSALAADAGWRLADHGAALSAGAVAAAFVAGCRSAATRGQITRFHRAVQRGARFRATSAARRRLSLSLLAYPKDKEENTDDIEDTVAQLRAARAQARQARQAQEEEQFEEQQTDLQEEQDDLGYVPSRDELQAEQNALLKATGALELQRRDEAYQERRRWRESNKSPLEKWQDEMEETKMDTQRRRLWGDLKRKATKKSRGLNYEKKNLEIKYNRGFPIQDTEEMDRNEELKEKKWMDMWRAAWPAMEAIDPHDPETMGFALIGEITGSHGLHGAVRIRVDDELADSGYDPREHLAHRNFSNWTEKSIRLHLKAPHRRFPRPYRLIKGSKNTRRSYACELQGIETIEEATDLRGYKVYILEPPPGMDENGEYLVDKQSEFEDVYNQDTTIFNYKDAMELVGSKCVTIPNDLPDEVLGDFAMAESNEEAMQVLASAGVEAKQVGKLSAVVPDYKIAPYKGRKLQAHSLLDITLDPGVVPLKKKYLYDADPASVEGQMLYQYKDLNWEQVSYVPFVADMIARVEAGGGDDDAERTVFLTLPKGHLEATTFTCRPRIVDERGLLVRPRGPAVRALLPAVGKSHALRRRDGKRLPLQGTAPVPPEDMVQPAGMVFPEPGPGVPRPPMERSRSWKRAPADEMPM